MSEINDLWERFSNGSLTEAERRVLVNLLMLEESDTARQLLAEHFADVKNLVQMEAGKANSMLEAILREGKQQVPARPVHRVHFIRRFRFAAAAVFLLAIATTYLLITHKTETPVIAYKTDVPAPVATKATLTLGNGKRIVLDSVMNGSLAAEGASSADKTADGKLVYNATATAIEYHTLTNPKASKPVELELPDKSIVWLNAESSVTFPTAFTGNERLVTMTGEASFRAVHDATKPFRVKVGNQIVEDIGTEFNINDYADEPVIKTTVIEGTIKTAGSLVHAGEEASMGANGLTIGKADVDAAIAWRKGLFSFKDADIQMVMKQLSRWYDVEVSYEGGLKPIHDINGKMGRSLTLAQALNVLGNMRIHYRIEDKKIVITP